LYNKHSQLQVFFGLFFINNLGLWLEYSRFTVKSGISGISQDIIKAVAEMFWPVPKWAFTDNIAT